MITTFYSMASQLFLKLSYCQKNLFYSSSEILQIMGSEWNIFRLLNMAGKVLSKA